LVRFIKLYLTCINRNNLVLNQTIIILEIFYLKSISKTNYTHFVDCNCSQLPSKKKFGFGFGSIGEKTWSSGYHRKPWDGRSWSSGDHGKPRSRRVSVKPRSLYWRKHL